MGCCGTAGACYSRFSPGVVLMVGSVPAGTRNRDLVSLRES